MSSTELSVLTGYIPLPWSIAAFILPYVIFCVFKIYCNHHVYTQRLQCSFFLVMTSFLLGVIIDYPKRNYIGAPGYTLKSSPKSYTHQTMMANPGSSEPLRICTSVTVHGAHPPFWGTRQRACQGFHSGGQGPFFADHFGVLGVGGLGFLY